MMMPEQPQARLEMLQQFAAALKPGLTEIFQARRVGHTNTGRAQCKSEGKELELSGVLC